MEVIGLGIGACGHMKAGSQFDDWNYSVAVSDWSKADVAVATVRSELARWGLGHHFGVTVRAVPCATLLEGSR